MIGKWKMIVLALLASAWLAEGAMAATNPDAVVRGYFAGLSQSQALARAAGGAPAVHAHGRSMTPMLMYAKAHWAALSPATRAMVRPWLARPTTAGATSRINGVTFYTAGQVISTYATTNFVFHYLDAAAYPTDANRANLAFVKQVAAEAEKVWAQEVNTMGYLAPPSDIAAADNGGDARYDIYMLDLGNAGLYGYVTTDAATPVGGAYPNRVYSHMVLDNDFAQAQYGYANPLTPAKVTLAHEFFHSIQYGYDPAELSAVLEQLSTWMEDKAYPTVKDNLQYIGEAFTDLNDNGQYDTGEPYTDRNGNGQRDGGSQDYPELHLDSFNVVGNEQYGRFLWIRYISDKFGDAAVKTLLANMGQTAGENTFPAFDAMLAANGSSLAAAFHEYGVWALDVGRFANGADYPMAWGDQVLNGANAITASSSSSPRLSNLKLNGFNPQLHLSTVYEHIASPSGSYDFTATGGMPKLSMLVRYSPGGAYTLQSVTLTNNGGTWSGTWTAPAGAVKAVAVISNASQATDGMSWTLASQSPVVSISAGGGGGGGGGGGCIAPAAGGGMALLPLLLLAGALVLARRRA